MNEEKTIARVVLETSNYVDHVIVCDDGSEDFTAEIAGKLGAHVIIHKENIGVGGAYASLFQKAMEYKPDAVITLDSDGQHDPKEIPQLVKPILDGEADVVVGSRLLGDSMTDMPSYRRFGNKLLSSLGGVSDSESGFRAYSMKAYMSIDTIEEKGYPACSEILRRLHGRGMRIMEVPINCKYEGIRPPRGNPARQFTGIMISILQFTIEAHPLLTLGVPGLLLVLIGSIYTRQVFYFYSVEGRIITNLALAAIAFIFLGVFVMFSSLMFYALSRIKKTIEGKMTCGQKTT